MIRRKNSRQIPKIVKYTADSKYHDILYSYLQDVSMVDTEKTRIVDSKDVNFTHLSKKLGISRQTLGKRFKGLQDLGLISEKSPGGYYILYLLDKKAAALIPEDVLEVLINTLQDRVISIYVYLMNKWIAAGEEECQFQLGHVKAFVGLSLASRSNEKLINDSLIILKQLGLIDYKVVTTLTDMGYRAHSLLTSVTNELSVLNVDKNANC